MKNTGPYILDMEFSAPAGEDGRYHEGETVEVTVVWSEAVTVENSPNGYPRLWLSYGGSGELIYHPSGSGTDRMVYNHTLQTVQGSSSFDRIGIRNCSRLRGSDRLSTGIAYLATALGTAKKPADLINSEQLPEFSTIRSYSSPNTTIL